MITRCEAGGTILGGVFISTASLVGATLLVLSESEVPPLVLSELSGDLYNGWQGFLKSHSTSLTNSGYNFTGILGGCLTIKVFSIFTHYLFRVINILSR